MTAFICFLIGGCTVHCLILHGLKQTRFRFMMPAILWQSFLMCMLGITCLIAIGELVSEGNLSARDEMMAKITLCVCPTLFALQGLMLIIISKCRHYIQCKRRHIRNGLPPPVREVIRISNMNKVSSMELSVDSPYQLHTPRS
ncbi:unnamed protein product [Caenorhabditis bovis]|uniref:Uncharacterized protein n=1 Tax=Caenorhabditis bovis TaxID=2654633 RepID=A0A8S1EVT8_9PELO|nr:unnamed protein product [Caenorhabditis bovis]